MKQKINKIILILMSILILNVSADSCEGLMNAALYNDFQNILEAIRIIGVLLIVVLTSFELFSAVIASDDSKIKSVVNKFGKRFAILMILVFLPNLVNLLVKLYNPNYSTCIG